jgi:hypothetical protein
MSEEIKLQTTDYIDVLGSDNSDEYNKWQWVVRCNGKTKSGKADSESQAFSDASDEFNSIRFKNSAS